MCAQAGDAVGGARAGADLVRRAVLGGGQPEGVRPRALFRLTLLRDCIAHQTSTCQVLRCSAWQAGLGGFRAFTFVPQAGSRCLVLASHRSAAEHKHAALLYLLRARRALHVMLKHACASPRGTLFGLQDCAVTSRGVCAAGDGRISAGARGAGQGGLRPCSCRVCNPAHRRAPGGNAHVAGGG